jgi:superfamily II DNA or RNA helicase
MSALLRQELLTSAATAPILRNYQAECVTAIRQAFTRWRRVLFVLPTGGGKTVIFAFITSHAAAKGNQVSVLAHRAGSSTRSASRSPRWACRTAASSRATR